MEDNDLFIAAKTVNPFADTHKKKIHVRTQKMGNKWITTIDGLDTDLDQKKIARAMKKSLHCATTMIKNKDEEDIIQLQGNHADVLKAWLIDQQVLTKEEADERLFIHGA